MGKTKPSPAPEMPAPPDGMSMEGLPPEEIAALKAQGYTAFDDGVMVPPLAKKSGDFFQSPGGMPGNLAKPPLADQTGGAGMQGDVRSDIFRNLYRAGRRSGNQTLMDMARPPVPEMNPLDMIMNPPASEPPFYLSASPPPMPNYQQADVPQGPGPGFQQMQQRFPRATSLMQRQRPPQRGGMGY